jgi:hypothetical protein
MRKKTSLSERAKLIPDQLPEDGIKEGFMLVMKPGMHPLIKPDRANL